MKAVIAIDSFKGSMTSIEAGVSASEGLKRAYPSAEAHVFPIADGGEGTVEALVEGMGGKYAAVEVQNPMGRKIEAVYGIVNQSTAVIEMSAAAGITLLKQNELNPMIATTYGVGEMIKDAISLGCRDFIIGIGGSATNDGGVGMLQALGFKFTDINGSSVPYGAQGLQKIHSIDGSEALPELKACRFSIACDVTNPLYGENGCSKIYSPQKGATESQAREMDIAMRHYAKVTAEKYPDANPDYPGSGAAGGIGFAFMSFLKGELKPGIELILNLIKLEYAIENADLVITGEGRLDFQTAMGKAPVGIARLAKKYNKPVLAFAGSVTKDASACNDNGIDGFFPIVRSVCTLSEAMDNSNARANMADTVEQVLRAVKAINV